MDGEHRASCPMYRAFPFKSDDLVDAGPNRTPIRDVTAFRWWVEHELNDGTFNYTQAIRSGDILIFAWSEGRLPWIAVGECEVVSCVRNLARSGYQFKVSVKGIEAYDAPVDLPKRGGHHLTLTAEEYAELGSGARTNPSGSLDGRRLIFARVGWMRRYEGPSPDDPKPTGAGSYNARNVGYEVFNFQPLDGKYYGYFQTPQTESRIDLTRIDASSSGPTCSGVTVVWVASTEDRGQVIVGWYRNATVFQEVQEYPAGSGRDDWSYVCVAGAKNAFLLPEEERSFEVPAGKGGMGQSNTFYPLDSDGQPRLKDSRLAWVRHAANFIEARAAREGTSVQSGLEALAVGSGQGFLGNPVERERIEARAMGEAAAHFRRLGYDVEDRHVGNPYDLFYSKPGKKLYVEVKGTTTMGESVIVTPGEVRFARANAPQVSLFVLHSIVLDEGKSATGGASVIVHPWNPRAADLSPTGYTYRRGPG
jgi:uncharacterized protein DUF3883